MSRIRSATGCWTCKLRRKKCGEEKLACAVCSALGLKCSGYGSRPGWMDGGPREKDRLVAIQETVKRVTSQRKSAAMQRRQKSKEYITSIDPPPLNVQPARITPAAVTTSLEDVSSPQQDKSLLVDGPPPGLIPENAATYVAQNEAVLLMHYLDNVFPCQFRFYQPSLEDGGRGWLLSLLMQTKPLYHAACSLAAYHRQMRYCLEGGMKKGCFIIEALHLQYDVAITELRRYLEKLISSDDERTLAEDVQLLCSIVLLVSIEGFISSTEAWQVHLAAALSIFPDINKRLRDVTAQNLGTETSRAALSFFSTVLASYSIISCATTSPKIFSPCSHKIDVDFTHFDKIIGCESWVMLAMVDIIALDQWKKKLRATGQLSLRELVSRGNEIETRLMTGFKNVQDTQLKSNSNGSFLTAHQGSAISRVTRVYYFATLAYLHVVISGAWPHLPEIRHAVAQSIEAFKALPDPELVNNLIWPLCITGCMATESDQDFFNGFSLFGNPNDGKFGASKARVIMEECWRLRRVEPDSVEVDWRVAMDRLGFRILLV